MKTNEEIKKLSEYAIALGKSTRQYIINTYIENGLSEKKAKEDLSKMNIRVY